jgi:hypothetical protein
LDNIWGDKVQKIINIFLVILSFTIFQTQLKAEEEIGSQHTVGLGFLLAYEYSEPHFMHLRGGIIATDNEYENIELLYNFKKSFLKNNYLSEIELDTSYQFQTESYWSNGSGLMENIDVEIYNIRALYGLQLSKKLMLKSGLGYRHLYHHWKGRTTTTGAAGGDRIQDYTYIPIIAELKDGIGNLKIEFDYVIEGNNTSYGAQNASSTKFKNHDGFMFKTSYKIENNGLSFEPYYEFLAIEESDWVNSSKEPSNITNEVGIRIKKEFNSNRSTVSNYKKIMNNDEYYYGVQALMSEVESGFYSPTGTGKIEEEGTGFSIISGMQILDSVRGFPLKLNFEIAFNQFGNSEFRCNSGATMLTDGRYANKLYSAGTTLNCTSDNIVIAIESHSVSFGIKPNYKIIDNLYINANLGFHRWDQSENTYWPDSGNSSTLTSYGGTDIYMGTGIDYRNKNFTFGIEYLEHTMRYDAKSFVGSLKYNF